MKSVFVFLCFVVAFVVAGPSILSRYNDVHKECQNDPDLFVKEEIFEELRKGGNPTLPSNFGDHAFCMLSSLDLQDEDGDVSEPGVRQAVLEANVPNAEEIIKECSAIDKVPDEAAIALFGCLGKYKVNIGQF